MNNIKQVLKEEKVVTILLRDKLSCVANDGLAAVEKFFGQEAILNCQQSFDWHSHFISK